MKKVLFLINSLGIGGAEKVLVDTVNNLDSKKYDITVQTVVDYGENKKKLAQHICYKSIVRFKNKFLLYLAKRLIYKVFSAKLVYNLFVKDNYDYEIAFLEGYPTKVLSASSSKYSKKYAWVHTDLIAFPDSYHTYGSEEKEKDAYSRFDKIFCVSEFAKNQIKRKYDIPDDKLRVVYNVIDESTILNAAKESAELPVTKKPLFISVGRLVEQKGFERLLRVHHRLIREGLIHSLIIIGDGKLRSTLTEYINMNQLSDTAVLLGYDANPHKFVNKADLFICASLTEGFNTSVSESLICNTPVLSTNVAGANEPIESPRCSIIVDNTEEALYNSLKTLLMCPENIDSLREDLSSRSAWLTKKNLVLELEKKVFDK